MTSSHLHPLTKESSKESSESSFPASSSRSSGRSSSFSSLSTLSCESPVSPATHLQFHGVPFSWEKLPGIPKNETRLIKKRELSATSFHLPLPPTALTTPKSTPWNRYHTDHSSSRNKKSTSRQESSKLHESSEDPFLAAFVKCCTEDDDDHHPVPRSLKMPTNASNRLGFFNLYTICKTPGPVAESIVYLPRRRTLF